MFRKLAEYDDTLTEEEKAIARFQKERLKRARKRAPPTTLAALLLFHGCRVFLEDVHIAWVGYA